MKLKLVLFASVAVFFIGANAADSVWQGGTGGSWFDAANWSAGGTGGTYGAPGSGVKYCSALFAGTGRLRVRRPSATTVLFR